MKPTNANIVDITAGGGLCEGKGEEGGVIKVEFYIVKDMHTKMRETLLSKKEGNML